MESATPSDVEEGGDVKTGAQRGTMQLEKRDSAQQDEAQRSHLSEVEVLLTANKPTPTHASVWPPTVTHQERGCLWEESMRRPDDSGHRRSDTLDTDSSPSPDEMRVTPDMLRATGETDAESAFLELQRDRSVDQPIDVVTRENQGAYRGARPKERRSEVQLPAEQRQEVPYEQRS